MMQQQRLNLNRSQDQKSSAMIAAPKKKLTQAELFKIEKERRDRLFRDKNAANFNITGEKSYEKGYPVTKVKKVFYNDILSYDQFIEHSVKASMEDKSLNLAPMTRKLHEVL